MRAEPTPARDGHRADGPLHSHSDPLFALAIREQPFYSSASCQVSGIRRRAVSSRVYEQCDGLRSFVCSESRGPATRFMDRELAIRLTAFDSAWKPTHALPSRSMLRRPKLLNSREQHSGRKRRAEPGSSQCVHHGRAAWTGPSTNASCQPEKPEN